MATYRSQTRPTRTRKALAFAVVLVGPDDEGAEQVLARFQYAGDANLYAQQLAQRPFPPGEWQVIAKNV